MKAKKRKRIIDEWDKMIKNYVIASVASSREPNSAYQTGGRPRGVSSGSSRIGTTGSKN